MSTMIAEPSIFRQSVYLSETAVAFGRDSKFSFYNQVLSVVSNTFNVQAQDLRAPTRCQKRIAFARQVAMYLTHIAGGMTFSQVGRLFERDRTTAAYACRVVEDWRDDPEFDHVLARLEHILELYRGMHFCDDS